MNRPDDRFHDPLLKPTSRPSRIPRLIGLRDSGRIPQVFTHRAFVESHQARIGEPLHHVTQPTPIVKGSGMAYDRDRDPHSPPPNVALALARLVRHAHKPGTVGYEDVGQSGDLVRDFYDLPTLDDHGNPT